MDFDSITVPAGVDPAVFWAAVREAIEQVKASDDGAEHIDEVTLDTSEPAETALTESTPYVQPDVKEGVINHATFEISVTEGGRYGEVAPAPTGPFTSGDGDETTIDTSGGTRVRARRTDPSTVAWHVLETMRVCVENENKPEVASDVSLPDKIGWVIASPHHSAVYGNSRHYRGYNGRDLIEDVKAHVGAEYTRAQIRTALAALVAAGSVVEAGKVSKAKRYTLSEALYNTAMAAGKGA